MVEQPQTPDEDWSAGAWQALVRRARLSRTEHSVAMTLSTYADFDTGRHARPGIAVLAIDCKLSYNVVANALARLRTLGLIEITRRSRGWGRADEYRLTVHPDTGDRIEVLEPGQVRTAAERMRRGRRGAEARSKERIREQQPVARVVPPVDNPAEQPTPKVVTGEEQPTGRVVQTEVTGQETIHAVCTTRQKQPTRRVDNNPRRDPLPPIDQPPTDHHPHPLQADANHQTARADTAKNRDSRMIEPDPARASPLPERCPHGFRPRYRPDGQSSCALCRRAVPTGAEPPPQRPDLHLVQPA